VINVDRMSGENFKERMRIEWVLAKCTVFRLAKRQESTIG
jgi:hypothetical protein